jgi:hypothetical protein
MLLHLPEVCCIHNGSCLTIVGYQYTINAHSVGTLWSIGALLASQTTPTISTVYWIRSTHGKDSENDASGIANRIALGQHSERQQKSEKEMHCQDILSRWKYVVLRRRTG